MLQIDFAEFPVLETERLLLRQLVPADADDLFVMRSNPRLMQHIDRPVAATTADAAYLIACIHENYQKTEGITWGICLKPATAVIGTIGFWRLVKLHHRAEIGYMLNEDYHRLGIMQEAMKAALGFGFQTMQLHSVEAQVSTANLASQQLLLKNGFRLEAHFRENYFSDGRFTDTLVYSKLATE